MTARMGRQAPQLAALLALLLAAFAAVSVLPHGIGTAGETGAAVYLVAVATAVARGVRAAAIVGATLVVLTAAAAGVLVLAGAVTAGWRR